tara:strand:- start:826 stop:1164 length:339 start_codon:yes stop_codon:yes gene_type:complete
MLGGSVTAIASWIGTFINPLIAAIYWSYPISILPTIYFMKRYSKDNLYISKYLISTTFALILLMIATFFMAYFIKTTNNIILSIFKSTIIWFICSLIFYYGVIFLKLDKYFM